MKSFTPSKLRLTLSLCIVILLIGGIGLFMAGYSKLKEFSTTTQEIANQAQASQSSIQDLTTTKKLLEQNSKAVERAKELVAESQRYVYQDKIINDINAYATKANLSVTNISFSEPTTTAVGGGAPNGVKSMTATVTLKNPANYTDMLNFIHYIEQSLFRMQVSRVGMSATSDNPDQVSGDVLTIEVYVR